MQEKDPVQAALDNANRAATAAHADLDRIPRLRSARYNPSVSAWQDAGYPALNTLYPAVLPPSVAGALCNCLFKASKPRS